MLDDLKSREELQAEIDSLRQQLAKAFAVPAGPGFIRLVLDNDPDLIFVKDAQGHFLFANRAMADLYVLSPEELVRQSRAGLLPAPPEMADYQRIEQKVLRTGCPISTEERNTRPDGQVRWYHTIKTPLVLADGTTHVLGIAAEITQRKLTMEALRASEERFRNLLEHAADAAFVWDQHGRLVDVNQQACDSLGLSRTELLERTPAELGLVGAEHLQPGQHLTSQGQQRRKDGTTFPVEVRIAQSQTLGRRFTLALVRDTSERQRVEESLRRSNDALQALILAAPVAIYALDTQGLVRSWNPAAERMFGWREHEVLGQPPPMVGPDKEDEVLALRERLLRGESVAGVEARRQRKDGTPIDVSLSAAPLRAADGRVIGIMAVAAEVTEAKLLQE